MSREAFERGDWQAVIEAHPLESHDPAAWLRYGAALLHTIEPGPEQGRQQQQAALAFVQAQKEGASAEAVQTAQRQVVLLSLRQALQLVGEDGAAGRVGDLVDRLSRIERFHGLLARQQWLEAWAELSTLPEGFNDSKDLKQILKRTILAAMSGASLESPPVDYAGVNRLRELQGAPTISNMQQALQVTTHLDHATPIVLVKNYSSVQARLEKQPFWIACGNVRSGSTMVFNLLRILANSISDGVVSAWEGDFASPQKFFELVDESPGVKLGVLKIHSASDAVHARLTRAEARAVLSHRDMRSACLSYWRMLHNNKSPFYRPSPEKELLDRFIENETRSFLLKSGQANTLIVRESDLRTETKQAVQVISEFLGIALEDESVHHLSELLGVASLRVLAEGNDRRTNSTGHESTTYFHPGHIALQASEHECDESIKGYISFLVQDKYVSLLDEQYFCRLDPAVSSHRRP